MHSLSPAVLRPAISRVPSHVCAAHGRDRARVTLGDAHPDHGSHGRSWEHPLQGASMLSIGKLGVANGADYCLAKVANSVDDYYLVPRRGSGSGDREIRRTIGTGRNRRSGAVRNLLAGLSARATPSICQLRPRRLPVTTSRSLLPKVSRSFGRWGWGRGGRRLGRTRPGRGSCPRPPVIRGLLRSARAAMVSPRPRESSAPPSAIAPAGPATPSSTPI